MAAQSSAERAGLTTKVDLLAQLLDPDVRLQMRQPSGPAGNGVRLHAAGWRCRLLPG